MNFLKKSYRITDETAGLLPCLKYTVLFVCEWAEFKESHTTKLDMTLSVKKLWAGNKAQEAL